MVNLFKYIDSYIESNYNSDISSEGMVTHIISKANEVLEKEGYVCFWVTKDKVTLAKKVNCKETLDDEYLSSLLDKIYADFIKDTENRIWKKKCLA